MFVQRAGRAARDSQRTGLAVLLVEPSAFSVDIQATLEQQQSETVSTTQGKKGVKRKTRKKRVTVQKAEAISRGLKRGRVDPVHDKDPCLGQGQPAVNPDAEDENLLVFVQTRQCRRKVLTEVYSNEEPGKHKMHVN
jgi:superfamily II DNA helicase RecQ